MRSAHRPRTHRDAGGCRHPRPRPLAAAIRAVVSAGLLSGLAQPALAAGPLPVPATTWVSSGTAFQTVTGSTMDIDQQSSRVTLNWQSFDIDAGHAVNFRQPSADAEALNLIQQADPSRIFGALNANGRVYLLNPNGIVFGAGSQVNVHALIASTLNLTPEAAASGLLEAIDTAAKAAAFTADPDGSAPIVIERGARLTTAGTGRDGQILIFAPRIDSAGDIDTPDGQTILAAGGKVYLMAPKDPNLRGLLVEIDAGDVTDGDLDAYLNGTSATLAGSTINHTGSITTDRGNSTLAALALNQSGRVTATTSVKANGTIRLQARDRVVIRSATESVDGTPLAATSVNAALPQRGGKVVFGAGSVTAVSPRINDGDKNDQTAVDEVTQFESAVRVTGREIHLESNARVAATSGTVVLKAARQPNFNDPNVNDARITMAAGSVIDVAGTDTVLPQSRNLLTVDLRADELKDSPVQRDGILRGERVTVDVRRRGTHDDGRTWVGTPLADLNAALGTVKRDVYERNANGGTVSLDSEGDIIIAAGARIDLSGGSVSYQAGEVATTRLAYKGRAVDIADADPDIAYDAILAPVAISYVQRTTTGEQLNMGLTQTWATRSGTAGSYAAGYVEGRDAGSLSLNSPNLILEGEILARTERGIYQRKKDELPKSGALTISDDVAIRSLVFAAGNLLPAGFDFDRDALTSPDTFYLDPDLLGGDRPGRLTVDVGGRIHLPGASTLTLADGGSLTATAVAIDVDGDIVVPGGTVTLNAGGNSQDPAGNRLTLGAAATIDVAGLWVNDHRRANPDGTLAPTITKGGTVTLKSVYGDLDFAVGSRIDVSGGAQMTAAGQIKPGDAGTITLSTTPFDITDTTTLTLGGELLGYAVYPGSGAAGKGGTLKVTANGVCIGDCGAAAPGRLDLAPAYFQQGGFSGFELAASSKGLTVAAGTQLDVKALAYMPGSGAILLPNGGDLGSVSGAPALLADYAQNPTSLTLRSLAMNPGTLLADNAGYTGSTFAAAPILEIGDAAITTTAGGSITLEAAAAIHVDGALRAAGGQIALTMLKDNEDGGMVIDNARPDGSGGLIYDFIDSMGIWLGGTSVLDVAGAVVLDPPDRFGHRQGTVLDGGTIDLTANRGYIVAKDGAELRLGGADAVLDLPVSATNGNVRAARAVASDAGSIGLTAADGIVFDGAISAAAREDLGAMGGALAVTLDRGGSGGSSSKFEVNGGNTPFRSGALRATLAATAAEEGAGIAIGSDVPEALNGTVRLGADELQTAGLDALTIKVPSSAGALADRNDPLRLGTLVLDGDVDLTLGRGLRVDTAVIESGGGAARLAAGYVALGTDLAPVLLPDGTSGTGALTVTADLLDVTGSIRLDKFGQVDLVSRGDIRGRGLRGADVGGTAIDENRSLNGRLATSADLTLAARQIYPVTATDFTFVVTGDWDGSTVVVDPGRTLTTAAGGGGSPVLSAGGSLTLEAPNILHRGVLKAPMGEIDLRAAGGGITLAPGSVVSVAADGLIIPYGRLQGGFDWTFEYDPDPIAPRLVFNGTLDVLPGKRISLDAEAVDLQEGARIDLRGGGDLFAFEFVPGIGGSRDYLAPEVSPDLYAIAPMYAGGYAPYDPREILVNADARPNQFRMLDRTGIDLVPGSSITLAADTTLADGRTLARGSYALLPARYALLDPYLAGGAFLVQAAEGYTDILPGQQFARTDGGTVVAGYRSVAGTPYQDSRTTGFAIWSGSDADRRAEYARATANAYFPDYAIRSDQSAPRLPVDAGSLALLANTRLTLDADLLASAANGGRGMSLDLAAAKVGLVADPLASSLAADFLKVDAGALGRLGVESLLLGGVRTQTGSGVNLDVIATDVVVEAGASFTAPEILLAAEDEVAVGAAADAAHPTLKAAGSGPGGETFLIEGDGALLRLATGALSTVVRSGGTQGVLTIADNAIIEAPGSITLDAAGSTVLDGTVNVHGGAISLGATRINLGDAPGGTAGVVFTSEELQDLNAGEMIFTSRSSVDLYGDLDLSLRAVTIDAAGLRGFGATGEVAKLTVDGEMTLVNSAHVTDATAATGSGSLDITAGKLTLGDGDLSLAGYSAIDLTADEIIGAGHGHYTAGAGAIVTLDAARVTAASGARTAIIAQGGTVNIDRHAASAPLAAADSLGAEFDVEAAAINHAGNIELPAGIVRWHATGGDIVVATGSTLDVAGAGRSFAGEWRYAPGGKVILDADSGDIDLQDSAHIDVSGATGGGHAGTLDLSAPHGGIAINADLSAVAASGFSGGAIAIDTGSAATFAAGATPFAALAADGFTRSLSYRQRTGAVTVAAADTVTAQRIALSADAGDLTLAGDVDADGPRGGEVVLAAQGTVTMQDGSSIHARALEDGERGGRVEIFTASAANGSTVAGGFVMETDAAIDVSGGGVLDTLLMPTVTDHRDGQGGEVTIRMPRATALTVNDGDNTDVDALHLAGAITGASSTVIEGFQAYTDTSISGTEVNVTDAKYTQANTFMASATAIKTALGKSTDTSFHVRPGVEVRGVTDLALDADWFLNAWRFGTEPGVLTLRAAGNLAFNRSLTDGFNASAGTSDLNTHAQTSATLQPSLRSDESWSYRLVAGADLAGATPLAVLDESALVGALAGKGNMTVAAGSGGTLATLNPSNATSTPNFRAIRTGTGDIDVAAAGDLTLGNRASLIYTAGVNTGAAWAMSRDGGTSTFIVASSTAGARRFPGQGGDIRIEVGDDITVGAANDNERRFQLVNDWLWRSGSATGATAWTIAYDRFEQSVGALGGGDVAIRAGGDITNLSAVVPTIGRQDGGTGRTDSVTVITGGGDLTVAAGGNIGSGNFYAGRGSARIEGEALTSTRDFVISATNKKPFRTTLALGDATAEVVAYGDIAMETVFNPTLSYPGRYQTIGASRAHMSTYSDATAVHLLSVSGDIVLNNDTASIRAVSGTSINSDNDYTWSIYPADVSITALDGDIDLGRIFSLYPAPKGNLELLAGDSVSLDTAAGVAYVIVSDTEPATFALTSPVGSMQLADLRNAFISTTATSSYRHATVPVHADERQPDGIRDDEPVRVVARRGAIDNLRLALPKPALIAAGTDVVNLSLVGQHVEAGQITLVRAGRDFAYPLERNGGGGIETVLQSEVVIDGPGRLVIEAGRDINLGVSPGISTRGNLDNPVLDESGAGIALFAGLGSGDRDLDAYIDTYLRRGELEVTPELYERLVDRYRPQIDSGATAAGWADGYTPRTIALDYQAELRDYLREVTGEDLAGAAALARFEALDRVQQEPLLTRILFSELRTAGRDAVLNNQPEGYVRGYAAIDAYFPDNGASGDISLFFSRIYSLDGGDVNVVAANGAVNAGLASPPASFGIDKEAEELGVVAQSLGDINALTLGDFLVNESRVFAADGGDILMWSSAKDIDAGRGAKTALSVPPASVTFDIVSAAVKTSQPAALQGSGIRAFVTSLAASPGDVDLYAPGGVVNAGDAGIGTEGNLIVGAQQFLGQNNIDIGGSVATSAPTVDAGAVSGGLSGIGDTSSSATKAATEVAESAAGNQSAEQAAQAMAAAPMLNLITVEVIGFGS